MPPQMLSTLQTPRNTNRIRKKKKKGSGGGREPGLLGEMADSRIRVGNM